jgi:methionyl-tRNA formyltransferase
MGTPQFAVPILEKIYQKHQVIMVVTQPDTYNHKKKKTLPSPVKTWALNHNIQVFQPENINKETSKILQEDVDLIVTAAYGQFISKALLEHPRYKAINVHGSLLPKYRGGAPIQRALINGEKKTGISIIYMTVKMDAGAILMQKEIEIRETDNQDSLFERLSLLGSEMILDVIDNLEAGTITSLPQKEEQVSFAYNLTKEDELLDFSKTALEVYNRIRGLAANPGAYFQMDGQAIKVYQARLANYQTDIRPGVIVNITKDSFDISCAKGSVIQITEIQMPSKKRLMVRDFLNGNGRNIIIKNKEIK